MDADPPPHGTEAFWKTGFRSPSMFKTVSSSGSVLIKIFISCGGSKSSYGGRWTFKWRRGGSVGQWSQICITLDAGSVAAKKVKARIRIQIKVKFVDPHQWKRDPDPDPHHSVTVTDPQHCLHANDSFLDAVLGKFCPFSSNCKVGSSVTCTVLFLYAVPIGCLAIFQWQCYRQNLKTSELTEL